jgi:diguanylate cyclase
MITSDPPSERRLPVGALLGAIVVIVAIYAAVPLARNAALQLLCLAVALGLFTHSPRQVTTVSLSACGLLALAMLGLWSTGTQGFDSVRDGTNGLLACLFMLVLGQAIHHFSVKHEELSEQQSTMATTLARMEQLATRDPLTGLFNTRHMTELMNQHAKRSERADLPMSLGLIDLDQFQRVNERFGHAVGDEALVAVSRIATEVFRQTDVIGRWGGEELLVLFTDTEPEQALLGLERLRDRLAGQDLSVARLGVKVTFSAGLVVWQEGEDMDATLTRARHALLRAKHEGRDRTVTGHFNPATLS